MIVVRGVAQARAALALIAASVGKRPLRNIQDAGVVFVLGRSRAASTQRIADEVEREVDQAIRVAGF